MGRAGGKNRRPRMTIAGRFCSKGRATYGCMLLLARDNPDVLNRPPIDRTRSIQ
jgi:hypothetical protein